ncbi:MAG: hypothetical protein ACYCX2_05185 [Christensenellales bacterium]
MDQIWDQIIKAPFFTVLIGFLAIYFAVLAIRGKGKGYELEKIREEDKAEYIKTARTYFGIGAALAIAMAVFSFMNQLFPLIGVFVALIVIIIVMTKTTKKYYKH